MLWHGWVDLAAAAIDQVNGRTLSSQPVVGADDFEVELRTDPHGVGVDQLLHHEGAAVAAHHSCLRKLSDFGD